MRILALVLIILGGTSCKSREYIQNVGVSRVELIPRMIIAGKNGLIAISCQCNKRYENGGSIYLGRRYVWAEPSKIRDEVSYYVGIGIAKPDQILNIEPEIKEGLWRVEPKQFDTPIISLPVPKNMGKDYFKFYPVNDTRFKIPYRYKKKDYQLNFTRPVFGDASDMQVKWYHYPTQILQLPAFLVDTLTSPFAKKPTPPARKN